MLNKPDMLLEKSSPRKITAGILGNLLEHYDQALFSLLVPFIAPFLFESKDELTALILSYGLFAITLITRPLGALFFGWIGDRFRRKYALFYSLFGMAITIASLGSLPFLGVNHSYFPWILMWLRGAQSFCAAGESMNGAIFVLEHTAPAHRNWISALYGTSSTCGWLLASALMVGLGRWGDLATQWYWLCGLGMMTGVIGLALRMNSFSAKQEVHNEPYIPLTQWWAYRKILYRLITVSGFSYTTYYLSFNFMYSFAPLVGGVSKQAMIEMSTLLICLDVLLSPCFAYLANRIGQTRQMIWAALGTVVSAIPLFYLLQAATWGAVLCARVLIVIFGVGFSVTYHAWAQTLVPKRMRCRMISLGNALGAQFIGMPTTVVSLWVYQKSGWIGMPAVYLMVTALAAAYAVYRPKEKKILAPALL